MRALLMSFHSYNLFNHWKPAADYLATLFLITNQVYIFLNVRCNQEQLGLIH